MFDKISVLIYDLLGFPKIVQGVLQLTQKELKEAQMEINLWKQRAKDPRYIIEQYFENGLVWYDWNDERNVPRETRQQNYRDAQLILRSPILNNIKNHLIATGSQAAVLEEKHDTNMIRDFQMTVNGISLLMLELEQIKDPDKKAEQVQDPFSGI